MRPLILCVLLAWPAGAQFVDLAAPGHGDDLYYALQIPQPVADARTRGPSNSPIYRMGTVPPTLFLGPPAPVFPPNGPYLTGSPYFISPYYLVSHPQFSRDGSVFAYLGERVCLGGQGCVSVNTIQTTVQGVPGRGTLTFEGQGWLSGNGRYMLVQPQPPPGNPDWPAVVDLQTGQQHVASFAITSGLGTIGRVVADDGTAILSGCVEGAFGGTANHLCVFRHGQLTVSRLQSASEPVIDSAAQVALYTSIPAGGVGPRYLRRYDIATQQDRVFVQPNGDTYSPSLSADGKRVMFLSTAQWGTTNPPRVAQLYAVNLDGTGFLELTSGSEPTGVQQYTMSDDGEVAWYVSGDAKVVKLDLSAGQAVRTVFRPAAIDLSSALVPGSATRLGGVGISDARVTVNGIAAPVLSIAPDGITIQVPWETPTGQSVNLQAVTNAGSAQATATPIVSRPALIPNGALSDVGGAAIHQDWSGYVTQNSPALPGEVLHFFGTGFGPVIPSVATGAPSPANPLAMTPGVPSCTTDPGDGVKVVYLGLAPGLVGYYQMDVQLPPAFLAGHPTENTTYDRFYIDCGGAIAIFAIQTKAP